jgi:predicted MPP superfamily phosphohydrolase
MNRFIIILSLVIGLAAYVCWHLWRITPGGWPLKLTVTGVFLLWMASEFAGFALMEKLPLKAAIVWYEVANTWLIAFLYLLLLFIAADIAFLCHLLPKDFLRDNAAALGTFISLTGLILSLGGIHYHHKYRKEMTIVTDKPLEKDLTVVLASDLHLGYHNRKAELGRWVGLINAEKPDLVLFGGDIVDMSVRPIIEGNYAEEFHRIQAPAFTILGNHEYYGDWKKAERFFADAGITLLRDSVAHFEGIEVIGRNDLTSRSRAALKDLAEGQDGFLIVLDHQPYHLEEAEASGIDFQFSGHTHRGQVWPVSWITDALFEKAWGYHRRGHTQYYISSGLGIWGPKIRVGTRSEYLVLHIKASSAGQSRHASDSTAQIFSRP